MSNKKNSNWSWSISNEDLNSQVVNYKTLKIKESYRGISVLIVAVLLAISLLLAFFFELYPVEDILYSLVIYIPVLFFVYRGHRWAIILLMVLWTFEQAYALVNNGRIIAILWWFIVMPYFYKALKVENARQKYNLAVKGSGYCTKCGFPLEGDSKFCTNCGNKITTN